MKMDIIEVFPETLVIGSKDDRNIKLLMDWLNHYESNTFRINACQSKLMIKNYNMQTRSLTIIVDYDEQRFILNLDNLKTTFYRACKLSFYEIANPLNNDVNFGLRDYNIVFKNNVDSFFEFFLRKNSFFIGTWESGLINKLVVLEEAKNIGFKIPESHLITDKKRIENSDNYISKSFGLPYRGEIGKFKLTSYTDKIDFKNSSDWFLTSLIQKEIKKLFEIRTFVFLNHSYSIAIFSQMNEKSSVDYRKYDHDNPYLNEPFILPKELEQKVFRLMKNLNLNTGSIDFIYSTTGEFYFLEVNPNGQFGNVGYINGIDLYKVMADEIIKYERKN